MRPPRAPPSALPWAIELRPFRARTRQCVGGYWAGDHTPATSHQDGEGYHRNRDPRCRRRSPLVLSPRVPVYARLRGEALRRLEVGAGVVGDGEQRDLSDRLGDAEQRGGVALE